ncbi:protein trichome birefringence-like 34 [Elaeis guineensis]|uniref:Protein trichome birefringence-like 34 n=1 Tax=Elaeis guineensis var. tenera TaxID=51953 RepID=A0A8N4F7C6_ELAGV|nr:protein trichome birefringence-like 34 [Elaeis guineensis]
MTTYYGPLGLRNCFSSLITLFLTIFAISLFLNKAHLRQEETPTPPPSSPPAVLNVSKVERQEEITIPILPPPVALNLSKFERQEEITTPILPPPVPLNLSKVERQEERITIPYPPPPPPPPPPIAWNALEGDDKCDLFSGRWVYDNSTHPLYSWQNCSFMHDEIACEKFGRKDRLYKNWRWQPHGCDIPRFNSTKLLERLRGKRMVFVGDSLNRNQWVSMVCLVESSIPPEQKSMKFNGSLLSFNAKEFNASIDFYWSPLLLESNGDDPVIHRTSERIVRAHSIEKHAKHWTDADVIVFNSYLWWKKPGIKLKILHGSFEDKDKDFEEIELALGLEVALRTWSEWLESHVDTNKTQLFFVSLSPTHVWADEWGKPSDQNCYTETEPITKEGYASRGTDYSLMRTVEAAVEGLRYKGVHVQILNITQLSEYRKDGHPSIFRRQYAPLTEEQLANPTSYSDCTHWCLPGVPDTWNELLYTYIMSR